MHQELSSAQVRWENDLYEVKGVINESIAAIMLQTPTAPHLLSRTIQEVSGT